MVPAIVARLYVVGAVATFAMLIGARKGRVGLAGDHNSPLLILVGALLGAIVWPIVILQGVIAVLFTDDWKD